MQTKKQFLSVFIFLLLVSSASMYSQDIPPKNEVEIPSEEELETVTKDTLTIPIRPQIDERNDVLIDTVKTDTIKPQKELLTDVVTYYGEDYVFIDRDKNKVYMYNKAYIIYEDMRIDAGLIILDYNKNEVYAKGIDSAGTYTQKPLFVQASRFESN